MTIYQGQKMCYGHRNRLDVCEHIENCDLCIMGDIDEKGHEIYLCGLCAPSFRCKRDNPDWKPLTKTEFIELYKQMHGKTNISIGDLLEGAIIDGLVEK